MRRQIGQLRVLGMLRDSQRYVVAVDMHLIPRYDKKYGADLAGSKRKSGTNLPEHCHGQYVRHPNILI